MGEVASGSQAGCGYTGEGRCDESTHFRPAISISVRHDTGQVDSVTASGGGTATPRDRQHSAQADRPSHRISRRAGSAQSLYPADGRDAETISGTLWHCPIEQWPDATRLHFDLILIR